MNRTAADIIRLRRGRSRQRGFNFAEVLFAVMILGIGFIMVAAIFPVALMQTRITQDQSTAATIARGGANYIEQIADNTTMPATGNVVVAMDQLTAVRGTMLVSADERYAWVPFYRRAGDPADPRTWSAFAQIYMLPVAARSRASFDTGAPYVVGNVAGGLRTASMTATVYNSTEVPEGVDVIEFPSDGADNYTVVAEGAYVIIASSPAAVVTGQPARVGHIFRIGNPVEGQTGYPRRWELVPGNDYVPLAGDFDGNGTVETPMTLDDVAVFVVGRGLVDPSQNYNATSNPREGAGQDVAAYTSFVTIR